MLVLRCSKYFLLITALSGITLPVSVLSEYWEWSTINQDLLTSNLPWDYTVTSYEGGKLIIVSKEKEELLRTDWLNNPSVMADSHNGLWSSCLSVSGRKDGEWRQ